MKTTLKILKYVVISAMLLLLVTGTYIYFSPIPSYENKAPTLKISGDSAMVAEGARIASMLCVSCHLSADGRLGGARVVDANDFGEIYAPNITQHPSLSATSSYSDGELAYLIRTGIKKNGQYAPPYMPKLPHISNHDLECIIAFLRSDHPLVRASENKSMESKPNFMTKFLCRVAFKPFPYPQEEIEAPLQTDKVAFGKYIALAKFECFSCHSQNFKSNDYLNPEQSVGFFGGGNPFKDENGKVFYSANLTMDPTGLGAWTETDFIKALKTGIRPHGEAVRKPMMPYIQLTDDEASAIWTYLNTLPKIQNNVKDLK